MALRDLFVRIKGDSSGLDSALDKSERSLQSFAFGAAKWLKAAFATTAILEFTKMVIDASEGLSDKFTFAVAGAKGALNEFFRMLGTGDFTKFFANLTEGYDKAHKLAEEIDALADKKAYSEYKISGLKDDSAKLQEVIKNKNADLEVRKRAAVEVIKIERQIKDMTDKIAKETFELESKAWENRNKMSVEEANALYEKVASISLKSKQELDDAYNKYIKEHGLAAFLTGSAGFTGQMPFVDMQEGIMGISLEYKKYFDLLQTGEAEVLPKLYKSFQTFSEATTQSQDRFNGILRITNALLADESKNLESGVSKINGISAVGSIKSQPYDKEAVNIRRRVVQQAIKDRGGDKLRGAPNVKTAGGVDIFALQESQESLDEYMKNIENILQDGKQMAMDLGLEFVDALGQAIGGGNMKEIGQGLLLSFANFMSTFGKMLITLGIAMEAFQQSLKNLFTNPFVAIGAGVALIATAGIIKGAASKAASRVTAGGGGESGGGYSSPQQNFEGMKIELTGVLKGSDIYISGQRYVKELNSNT